MPPTLTMWSLGLLGCSALHDLTLPPAPPSPPPLQYGWPAALQDLDAEGLDLLQSSYASDPQWACKVCRGAGVWLPRTGQLSSDARVGGPLRRLGHRATAPTRRPSRPGMRQGDLRLHAPATLRAGRVVIELLTDVAPKACENFRCLCTGEKGKGKSSGKPLHFKGSPFHRIVKGFVCQGGDIAKGARGADRRVVVRARRHVLMCIRTPVQVGGPVLRRHACAVGARNCVMNPRLAPPALAHQATALAGTASTARPSTMKNRA